MSKFNTLEVNREKGVARVWLNRPDVRNAFNDQMIKELTQIFIDLASDDSCRVIVLGGKGSVFCAGADLNWMKKMATYTQAQNQSDAEKLSEMLDLLYRIPKPTIARVHGHAFAGGMGLVSACDIAVASTKTQFCLSEVKLGLIPATIGPYVFNSLGFRAARRYMLSGERFSSHEAYRIGFVHEVVEQEEIDAKTDTLIGELISGGANAHRETKLLIEQIHQSTLDRSLIMDTASRIARIRTSDEGQEGIRSFLEKRPPSWISDSGEQ